MKRICRAAEIPVLAEEIADLEYNGKTVGLTGGHFNPLTGSHIDLLRDSLSKVDFLVVAVNSDESSIRKRGYSFMPVEQRLSIISAIRYVDYVVENPFDDMSYLIRELKCNYYLKGGDVCEATLAQPEKDACREVACKIQYGVGGEKIESSSRLLENYYHYRFFRSGT